MVIVFTALPVKEPGGEVFFIFLKHTIQFLSQCPDLVQKFQRAIAKTKNGQAYYFELYVYLDKLNSFYGEGLRFYLSEKKTTEGQVFGYSLLCLRDWFSNNHDSLRKNFAYVKKQSLPRTAEPYLYGKYFAAYLLYAEAFNLGTQKVLAEAYKAYLELKHSGDRQYLCKSFEYTLANVLIWTRHYQDAIYYINEAFLNYPETSLPLDQIGFRRLTLLKAAAFAQSGIMDEAERLLGQIQPSQFAFLSKKRIRFCTY